MTSSGTCSALHSIPVHCTKYQNTLACFTPASFFAWKPSRLVHFVFPTSLLPTMAASSWQVNYYSPSELSQCSQTCHPQEHYVLRALMSYRNMWKSVLTVFFSP
jgi:hypothetical protein